MAFYIRYRIACDGPGKAWYKILGLENAVNLAEEFSGLEVYFPRWLKEIDMRLSRIYWRDTPLWIRQLLMKNRYGLKKA